VAEKRYTGFALDVTRGPVIRGADGRAWSALRAEAAVPQARRMTPQTAAYWAAAAFNARHLRKWPGHLQELSDDNLGEERTGRLKQSRRI